MCKSARGLTPPSGSARNTTLPSKPFALWNKKEPAEWSSDEIDKLVTKSPWARQITASSPAMSRQYGGSGGNGGGTGDPGIGGGGGGGSYPGGGGGGYPGGGGMGSPGGGGVGGR